MTIRHTDRTGKPWTFEIDCTPTQGRMFERLLLSVRNIGNREELNLSYLAELERNTAFRDELEHVVLSALREWNGATAAPPQPQHPAKVNDTDADGDGVRYYWENF